MPVGGERALVGAPGQAREELPLAPGEGARPDAPRDEEPRRR